MNGGAWNVVNTKSTWQRDTQKSHDNTKAHYQSHFYTFIHIDKLTPDPSPTQASDSETTVCTLNVNWNKKQSVSNQQTQNYY